MNRIALALFLHALSLLVLPMYVWADEGSVAGSQVKAILQARCYACHGVLKQNGGLRLDTVEFAMVGGDGGAAIVPGRASSSPLLERIAASDLATRMPPEGEPLKSSEVELIRKWIDDGAAAPLEDAPELDPNRHWAFIRPAKLAIPEASNSDWNLNPIDRWLANEQSHKGTSPQPDAPKKLWLRRVYLDLIGLPPTLEEQRAFESDSSTDAIEKVVTRLLDSPQYGERWGRHWMDIWRYSDAWGLGAEIRNSQKHLWRWRDWIIESLNEDKAYDQMLREMLAADELYPQDPSRLRATGFLARNYFKFNRTTWMDETIEHTAKSMLGLTMNCVKCHDHKYDPMSQLEYYQMRAFFEPYQIRMDMVNGELDFEKDAITRVFDCNLDAPTYLHVRGDDRNPDKQQTLSPRLPKFLAAATPVIEPVLLTAGVYAPSSTREVAVAHRLQVAKAMEVASHALHTALAKPEDSDEMELAELQLSSAIADRESLEARLVADAAIASAPTPLPDDHPAKQQVADAAKAQRVSDAKRAKVKWFQARLAWKKGADEKKAELQMAVDQASQSLENANKELQSNSLSYKSPAGSLKTLESNLEDEASRNKPFPRSSTGRRKVLSQWIASQENPLTARVAVNHIWARHFGQALVPTLFDFGRKGQSPTHPELLDWLAVDWMEHQWSMKYLHRMIVTSKAYRMSSSSLGADDATRKIDPENRTYWRFPGKRMESQLVRDTLLALAGKLDLRMMGPSVPFQDETANRRSLYYFQSHNEHNDFLSMFDDANVQDCYRRTESIVPQQSLALTNSKLIDEVAVAIAARIASVEATADPTVFIRHAFQSILCSDPNDEEIRLIESSMQQLRESWLKRNTPDEAAASRFARKEVVRAILNHNDFITVR